MNVVGDVEGRSCLIVDDMCDTGGRSRRSRKALKEAGADRVDACFTHPVLSGPRSDAPGELGPSSRLLLRTQFR
jgi:ribose-phosphate pyrophosphokinase